MTPLSLAHLQFTAVYGLNPLGLLPLKSLRMRYSLLYDVLHVKFIMQPDPNGQIFFSHYIHHLTQIIMCKDTSLLSQYLQGLCTYVDMVTFLKKGDTLLMYLLKKGV
jgi:hypothetical protein